jgi:septum formation protein
VRTPGAAERRRLILASRSPQRRAILEQLGISFELRPVDVDEKEDGLPEVCARGNALRKARAVTVEGPDEAILGVDTIVVLDGGIWGKPPDEAAARETLRALSGRTHTVVSGLALVEGGQARTAIASTAVSFRALGDDVVDWYVATGEWRGRAGGYAIQGRGAALVERIDGDYLNVVGLPVAALLDLSPGLLAQAS